MSAMSECKFTQSVFKVEVHFRVTWSRIEEYQNSREN